MNIYAGKIIRMYRVCKNQLGLRRWQFWGNCKVVWILVYDLSLIHCKYVCYVYKMLHKVDRENLISFPIITKWKSLNYFSHTLCMIADGYTKY